MLDIDELVCLSLLALAATQIRSLVVRIAAPPEWCDETSRLKTTSELLESFQAHVIGLARSQFVHDEGPVEAAKHFIEAHFAEPLTTAIVASSVRHERTYFATAFRRRTGETIHRYVVRVRLRYALTSLTAGEKVEAAMLSAGYRNSRSFYRDFRRQMGQTPSVYRDSRLGFCKSVAN